LRGGGWNNEAASSRVSSRNRNNMNNRNNNIGCRVVLAGHIPLSRLRVRQALSITVG
jgi:hypothetical protein